MRTAFAARSRRSVHLCVGRSRLCLGRDATATPQPTAEPTARTIPDLVLVMLLPDR
jgi:hypothetical protein